MREAYAEAARPGTLGASMLQPAAPLVASVVGELHLAQVVAVAGVAATVAFLWLERRGRGRWAQVPLSSGEATRGPYRSSAFVAATMTRAPLLVRAASFVCLAFAHVFAPLIVLALASFPVDMIAVPLVLGTPLVVLAWCCGWLLLARSPRAESAVRSVAHVSLVAEATILVLATGHVLFAELGVGEGIEHTCSSSVTFVMLAFAVASIVQTLVVIAALRAHASALTWSDAER